MTVPQALDVAPRRLHVVHRTGFRYDGPVLASYNEARMTPTTTDAQTTLDSRVDVDHVTWTHTFWDYWGTQVVAFDVLVPHEELTVVSASTVEVQASPSGSPAALGADDGAAWAALRSDAAYDDMVEWLVQTPATSPVEEVAALAREVAGDLPPARAAAEICATLHGRVAYVPGVTTVHTDAEQVWRTKQGVCQDFAHLTLGALRSVGVPARYVSGYLHPDPAAEVGRTVTGQSHAWVEFWAGGWYGYDPTHDVAVGADHVLVARGRDYGDVAPLKGVYAGTAASQMFVSVEVTRLS